MSDFENAVDFVSKHKDAFNKRVSRPEKLRLYALYKTATCGSTPDCPRPSGWTQTERIAMWDAWNATNMTVEVATQEYISRVKLLQIKFESK